MAWVFLYPGKNNIHEFFFNRNFLSLLDRHFPFSQSFVISGPKLSHVVKFGRGLRQHSEFVFVHSKNVSLFHL